MKSRIFFLFTMLLIFVFSSNAQVNNILNAETPDEVGELTEDQKKYNDDKPLTYGYVGDRDVLWSKVVWEKIDLNQKVNFPLLFPTDSRQFGESRRSLFQVLLDGIEEGASDNPDESAITEVYNDEYFKQKMDYEDIQDFLQNLRLPKPAIDILSQYGVINTEAVNKFKSRALAGTLDEYPNLYSPELISEMESYLAPDKITGSDIKQFHIKGIWYFDKRQGELKYRLLGIAPRGPDVRTKNSSDSNAKDLVAYFWVWYPDARNALYDANVLNKDNSAKPLNFDQILTARRFDAKIYKTQNLYQDREIKEYIEKNAMMQLLESNRIKEEIRNFELDMWKY